jgi:hypothetical protein
MTEPKKRRLKWIAAALVLGLVAILGWQHYRGGRGPDALASGNGRIEASEIDVAAKYAGRVREILVREGDFVKAGQVVAAEGAASSPLEKVPRPGDPGRDLRAAKPREKENETGKLGKVRKGSADSAPVLSSSTARGNE